MDRQRWAHKLAGGQRNKQSVGGQAEVGTRISKPGQGNNQLVKEEKGKDIVRNRRRSSSEQEYRQRRTQV